MTADPPNEFGRGIAFNKWNNFNPATINPNDLSTGDLSNIIVRALNENIRNQFFNELRGSSLIEYAHVVDAFKGGHNKCPIRLTYQWATSSLLEASDRSIRIHSDYQQVSHRPSSS